MLNECGHCLLLYLESKTALGPELTAIQAAWGVLANEDMSVGEGLHCASSYGRGLVLICPQQSPWC